MRAAATGAATCWLRAASAVAPLLVGQLMTAQGIAAVFMLFAVVALIGAVAGAGMLETRNRPLEELAP
jgi:putative MFS transporter